MNINPKAYAEPCGCGALAGEPCPHTPIRCKHDWLYGENPQYKSRQMPRMIGSVVRECCLCGYKQQCRFVWEPYREAQPPTEDRGDGKDFSSVARTPDGVSDQEGE